MKVNPKKLGGCKTDPMTPDWQLGYEIVKLNGQQALLCNTVSNQILKAVSLQHIKRPPLANVLQVDAGSECKVLPHLISVPPEGPALIVPSPPHMVSSAAPVARGTFNNTSSTWDFQQHQ